jgi:hypothetical protein
MSSALSLGDRNEPSKAMIVALIVGQSPLGQGFGGCVHSYLAEVFLGPTLTVGYHGANAEVWVGRPPRFGKGSTE